MQNNRILRGESFYQRYGVSPEGLVLWLDQSDYRSYGDAGNWYDLSGKGNHAVQATAAQQPSITGGQGIAGMYRDFDGTDDKLSVGDNASLRITTEITLEAWFYTGANWSAHRGLLSKFHWSPSQGYLFGLNDKKFRALYKCASGDVSHYPADVSNLNQWYYLVGIYSSTTGNSYLILDNSVISSSAVGKGAINTGSESLLVGFQAGANDEFDGGIAIARTWNRALSLAESQRLYLVDAPRFGLL